MNEKLKKIITEVCRCLLGVVFIFSGTVKNIDPVGGALKFDDYLGAFHLSSLKAISLFASINLSGLEFLLGLCLLVAVYRRLTTICLLLFMSFMTLLTLYLAIFNPVHDCGCFGDAFILTNWQTFFKNILILLPATIVTFLFYKKMTPLYSYRAYWFVPLFGYIFMLGFSYYNYYNLPVKDFRPYSVGSNIPQKMSIPEDAPLDEIEFIYAKDGKQKTFSMASLAEIDSTWTFVDSKIVKEGYRPPIISFELYDASDNNISDAILEEDKTVFLLVSPHLEDASDSNSDEINSIYDYARKHGYAFYGVTASAHESIEEWNNTTGAEYPFLTADDVTLKTIIRANPGLVMLRSGTIIQKWHYSNLPHEEVINAEIESLLNGEAKKNNPWIWIICCFVLPLLLVWLYDFKFLRQQT